MERIKYRFIVYNKLWSNPKMNLYVTNPQFNNIHAVAHLHPGVHPCTTTLHLQGWLADCVARLRSASERGPSNLTASRPTRIHTTDSMDDIDNLDNFS